MSRFNKHANVNLGDFTCDFPPELQIEDAHGIHAEGTGILRDLLKTIGGTTWFCEVGEA
jgi:hypothetical protein